MPIFVSCLQFPKIKITLPYGKSPEQPQYITQFGVAKHHFFPIFIQEVANSNPVLKTYFDRAQLRLANTGRSRPVHLPLHNPVQPSVIFRAYCEFLKRKEWIYDSAAGSNKESLTDSEKETIQGFMVEEIAMNPFMVPQRPKLACYDATYGLYFAMRSAGINEDSIKLVCMGIQQPKPGECFAFKGFDNIKTIDRVKYPHHLTLGHEISWNNGRIGINRLVTHNTIGIPFDNHVLLSVGGTFFDATYGIAFAGPAEDIFQICKSWDMTLPDTAGQEPDSLYQVDGSQTWFVKLRSQPRLERAKKELGGVKYDMFFTENPNKKAVKTDRGMVDVPLPLWVILEDQQGPATRQLTRQLRECLGKVVTSYESGRSIFRSPSAKSKDCLIRIRKYLKMDLAPAKTKFQRSTEGDRTRLSDEETWSDERARTVITSIMTVPAGNDNPVGDTLRNIIIRECRPILK